MRKVHYMPRNLKLTFILSLALFLGIEREVWKGQPVTEVELTAKDGVEYEVLISDSGEIVSIEEED